MLSLLFSICFQFPTKLKILGFILPTRAGACYGPRLDPIALSRYQSFRRGGNHSKISSFKNTHKGARIYFPQNSVETTGVPFPLGLKRLGEIRLINITVENIIFNL